MEDKVDNLEKEMQDMLKYLDDVSDMMQGDDLKKISKMIKYSKKSMGEHVKTIDNISLNV